VFLAGSTGDGTRIFFSTEESMLPSDTDTAEDAYARNADGGLTHISDHPTTEPDANTGASFVTAPAAGARVLFHTTERLLGTDTDTSFDVYARNADGTLSHLTDHPTTNPDTNITAGFGGASADGTRIFFFTAESLLPTDTDGAQDVYARNSDGSLTHISDHPGTNPDANIPVTFGRASADGARAFFTTAESMLVSDTDIAADVYGVRPAPPGPGPGPGPALLPGPPAVDRIRPVLSSVAAVPRVFTEGSLLPRLTAVGTSLRFTLSEAARVTLTFQRPRAGRRVGRRCLPPTRARRSRPRCTRYLTAGTLAVNGRQGRNRVRFQGRLNRRRRLGPGPYRIRLVAVDRAGNRSIPRITRIRILRARARRR
jgi:hypothetical protein